LSWVPQFDCTQPRHCVLGWPPPWHEVPQGIVQLCWQVHWKSAPSSWSEPGQGGFMPPLSVSEHVLHAPPPVLLLELTAVLLALVLEPEPPPQ
jgi:hypothetical protein